MAWRDDGSLANFTSHSAKISRIGSLGQETIHAILDNIADRAGETSQHGHTVEHGLKDNVRQAFVVHGWKQQDLRAQDHIHLVVAMNGPGENDMLDALGSHERLQLVQSRAVAGDDQFHRNAREPPLRQIERRDGDPRTLGRDDTRDEKYAQGRAVLQAV